MNPLESQKTMSKISQAPHASAPDAPETKGLQNAPPAAAPEQEKQEFLEAYRRSKANPKNTEATQKGQEQSKEAMASNSLRSAASRADATAEGAHARLASPLAPKPGEAKDMGTQFSPLPQGRSRADGSVGTAASAAPPSAKSTHPSSTTASTTVPSANSAHPGGATAPSAPPSHAATEHAAADHAAADHAKSSFSRADTSANAHSDAYTDSRATTPLEPGIAPGHLELGVAAVADKAAPAAAIQHADNALGRHATPQSHC